MMFISYLVVQGKDLCLWLPCRLSLSAFLLFSYKSHYPHPYPIHPDRVCFCVYVFFGPLKTLLFGTAKTDKTKTLLVIVILLLLYSVSILFGNVNICRNSIFSETPKKDYRRRGNQKKSENTINNVVVRNYQK